MLTNILFAEAASSGTTAAGGGISTIIMLNAIPVLAEIDESLTMDPTKIVEPHVFVRISISEAVFMLSDFSKVNGGLGYEERLVLKWFGRFGIKDKLNELWASSEKNKEDK